MTLRSLSGLVLVLVLVFRLEGIVPVWLMGLRQPAAGTTGRWLTESADIVATDADARVAAWSAASLPLIFPRDWPAIFSWSGALKRLVNRSMLKGTRCRAVPAWSGSDPRVMTLPVHHLHSFANALRAETTLGWSVIKGYQARVGAARTAR